MCLSLQEIEKTWVHSEKKVREDGMTRSPAKEHMGPPNLEEARKGPPLAPSEGTDHPHLDFSLLASRNVREYISIGVGHQAVVVC